MDVEIPGEERGNGVVRRAQMPHESRGDAGDGEAEQACRHQIFQQSRIGVVGLGDIGIQRFGDEARKNKQKRGQDLQGRR